jgi:hypothetical protein
LSNERCKKKLLRQAISGEVSEPSDVQDYGLAYVQPSPDIPVEKGGLIWQKHLNVTLLKLSFKLKSILGRGYDCFEDVVAQVMSWLSCLRPLGQNSFC